jgi:hypothetical protein
MEQEDEYDLYPPPREDEPDLGPEWNSDELYRETYTTESRGLLDDLQEANARRYHHNVTLLLLETRKLLRSLLEQYCKELTRVTHANPSWNKKQKQQAQDMANVSWNKESGELTAHMRQIVSAEGKVREERDEQIRTWVLCNLPDDIGNKLL